MSLIGDILPIGVYSYRYFYCITRNGYYLPHDIKFPPLFRASALPRFRTSARWKY